LDIEALADAAHLGFGDAALAAQCRHQLVHLVPPARWAAAR
jgi:hypothetical protein